jgi:hypothetical protein
MQELSIAQTREALFPLGGIPQSVMHVRFFQSLKRDMPSSHIGWRPISKQQHLTTNLTTIMAFIYEQHG